jgi:hypothetical protein
VAKTSVEKSVPPSKAPVSFFFLIKTTSLKLHNTLVDKYW